jgi:hypothetical protein
MHQCECSNDSRRLEQCLSFLETRFDETIRVTASRTNQSQQLRRVHDTILNGQRRIQRDQQQGEVMRSLWIVTASHRCSFQILFRTLLQLKTRMTRTALQNLEGKREIIFRELRPTLPIPRVRHTTAHLLAARLERSTMHPARNRFRALAKNQNRREGETRPYAPPIQPRSNPRHPRAPTTGQRHYRHALPLERDCRTRLPVSPRSPVPLEPRYLEGSTSQCS